MSYLPWLAGGALVGLAARRGSRAAKGPTDLPDGWRVQIHSDERRSSRVFITLRDDANRRIGHLQMSRYGSCGGAWVVTNSHAAPGWGPMLYDLGLEWAGSTGVMPDRGSVTPAAAAVWAHYLRQRRTDVEWYPVWDDPTIRDAEACGEHYPKGTPPFEREALDYRFVKKARTVLPALQAQGALKIAERAGYLHRKGAQGRRDVPFPMPPYLSLSSITVGAWTAVPRVWQKEDRWGGTTKLWDVEGPQKGFSLWRYWPKAWGFPTGTSRILRMKKGNSWIGHVQVEEARQGGENVWVVEKSHLDEAYRGTGLGSMMYLAARNMIEAYKFKPIKMISTKDYGGGGTSPMAQKVWDRLRGEGRLALKVVHQGNGREGQNRHLTRRSTGTLPTSVLLGLKGARGEHGLFERSPTGAKEATRWREFVESVRREGVREPVFVVVEWTDDLSPAMRRKLAGEPLEEVEAFVYEGNHRIRAAQEAGLAEVPVEVSYFGHAERRKGLLK